MSKILLVIIILFFLGCKESAKNEISKEVNNEYSKTIKTNTASINFRFIPKGSIGDPKTSDNSKDSSFIYFQAQFIFNQSDKQLNIAEAQYINFGIEKDFRLIIGRDSLLPAICQRMVMNNKNLLRYMLAFEKPEHYDGKENYRIYLDDHELGIGKISASF